MSSRFITAIAPLTSASAFAPSHIPLAARSSSSLASYLDSLGQQEQPVQAKTDAAPLQATTRAKLSSKEYQLEELEDKEECETELWLNEDGTVTLGMSNGPPVKDYKGDWHLLETASEEDKPFRMRLTRTFETKSMESTTHPSIRKWKDVTARGVANKVGDISYEVKREFWGNIEMVGNSISVSGKIHGNTDPNSSGNAYVDEQSVLESELGYFTMIDAVASEGVEGEKQSS